MGIQFCFSSKPIMKSLLLVALAFAAVVVAEPEADAAADAWYGYYGYPGCHRGYYGLGRYPYRYGYWKREAEAEPTAAANPDADASADAYYGYDRYYGGYYGGYYGYPYRGYYGRYWKREAEA